MSDEVFLFIVQEDDKKKIETVVAGHLRNGWKIDGFDVSGTYIYILFTRSSGVTQTK